MGDHHIPVHEWVRRRPGEAVVEPGLLNLPLAGGGWARPGPSRLHVPADGGEEGAKGELRINDQLVDPKQQHIVKTGDTITMRTPGGGGYGKPGDRDADAIAQDQAEGKIAE